MEFKRIALLCLIILAYVFSPNSLSAQICWGNSSLSDEEYNTHRAKKLSNRELSISKSLPKQLSFSWEQGEIQNPQKRSDSRMTYLYSSTIQVSLTTDQWGEWLFVPNRNLWVFRGRLTLEKAQSISIFFGKFTLPRDAELYIRSLTTGQILGAFTYKNNSESNSLPIAPIEGNTIEIEYHVSPEFLNSSAWRIDQLVGVQNSKNTLQSLDPLFHVEGLECAPNAILYPQWNKQMRSTVLIMVRGRGFCSGALINNNLHNGKAYVLTAAHCMNNAFENYEDYAYSEESARQSVFFFNFFSPVGDRFFRGIREQTLAGAKIIAFNEEKDMCLLEITGVDPDVEEGLCAIPPSYMPYLAGWNASFTPSGPFHGIHYPRGSVARYSLAAGEPILSDYSVLFMDWKMAHWKLDHWEIGTTERGSSGSPLFDNEGLIVGALSGGNSYCGLAKSDYYYALCQTFLPEKNLPEHLFLQPFLAPQSPQQTSCPGLEPFAPYAPIRMSHIMYNVLREQAARPKPLTQGMQGIGVKYNLNQDLSILGVTLVVDSIMSQSFDFDLVLYLGTHNPQQELVRKKVQIPPTASRVSPLQFFVDLSSHKIAMSSSQSLFVAIYPKDSTFCPIMKISSRLHPAQGDTFVIDNKHQWISQREDATPEIFWIDLLAQPTQAESLSTPDRYSVEKPQVTTEGEFLRILFPMADLEQAVPLRIYDLNGKLLYMTQIMDSDVRISIKELRNDESYWILTLYHHKRWLSYIFSSSFNSY